jgi:hypothetical protein
LTPLDEIVGTWPRSARESWAIPGEHLVKSLSQGKRQRDGD